MIIGKNAFIGKLLSKQVVWLTKSALVPVLSANLIMQPAIANAQMAPDLSVPANTPDIAAAQNGVPVVNIVAPSAAGVSHNKFSDFNVSSSGVVLNNSAQAGVSQLGGALLANPKLGGREASIILNEVTGSNGSNLKGFTEIFGNKAQYILANPNGITCSGCGFINTSRTTLTTGAPDVTGGQVNSIDVDNNSTIAIEGTGLNAQDAAALDLVARTVRFNAPVNANDLKVFTGRNLMDYGARTVTAKTVDGSTKPALAIDGSLFGAMYADQIEVIATEEGVGVRMPDKMVAGDGDLTITADGRIDIKDASSTQSINLASSSSDVSVTGNTNGGNTLTATADNGTITVAQDATVGAKDAVQISAQNFVNSGETLAGLNASGDATQQGTLVADVTGTLTNSGILSSGKDIKITSENTVNDGGAILAYDDLLIQGQNNERANSFLNQSGAVETASGDITIRANTVENRKKTFSTSSTLLFNQTYSESDGNPPRNPAGAGISPEGWAYLPDGRTVVVPHPDRGMSYASYYDFGAITVTQYRNEVTQDSSAGIISSGNDLIIDGGTITNRYSALSATRDITLTGTSFNNIAATLSKDLYFTNHGGRYNRCIGGPCRWYEDGANTVLVERTTYDSINATVQAGGTIHGDFTGQVNNTTIAQTVDDLNIERANKISSVGSEGPGTGEVNLLNLLDKIPGRGALVASAPADADYIYENRAKYADLGTFFGSDYFLSQVDIDVEAVPDKAAFDASLEARLVRDAVWMETGSRWLDPLTQDASQQLKNLIDNAKVAQNDLQLRAGIALSDDQISALQQDIVWYVTEKINGQEVLVPRLYLADGNKVKLAPSGALIAANDIEFSSSEIFNNSNIEADADINLEAAGNIENSNGVIAAGNDVSLVATGNIINRTDTYNLASTENEFQTVRGRTGSIQAGNNLSLAALENISVQGANLQSGEDTSLYAGNNVTIETVEMREKGGYDVGFHAESWDRTTHIGSEVQAGGDLSIQAGQNIAIAGSNVSADGDIALDASDTILVSSVENTSAGKSTGDFSNKSWEGESNKVTNKIAALTAGGSLTVRSSDGNILIKASKLSSGEETLLDASEGKVALLSATDSDYYSYKSDSSNAFWFKTQDKGHIEENVVMTEITADGGLIVNAGNGVVIEYRDTGNLEDSVAALAATPGLEWMGDMMARDDATWNAVQEVHKSWDYKAQGLSGAAAAVIAIAVTVATYGGAAAAGGAFAANLGMTATVNGVTTLTASGLAVQSAIAAGLSSLASQAAVSLVGNGGDIGAVLEQLGSSSTIRSLVTSMVSAGVLSGVGSVGIGDAFGNEVLNDLATDVLNNSIRSTISSSISTAINGGDLGDSLKNSLRSAIAMSIGSALAAEIGAEYKEMITNPDSTSEVDPESWVWHKVAHAALGCARGAIAQSGGCAAGAAGGVGGAVSSELYDWMTREDTLNTIQGMENWNPGDPLTAEQEEFFENWRQTGVDIGRIAGAASAALLAAESDEVYVGADSGESVARDNILPAVILIAKVGMVAWTAYELYDNATTAYELVDAYVNGELTDEQFADAALESGLNAVFEVSMGKLKILEKSYELARKAGLTDKADDLLRKIASHKNGGNNRPPVSNPSAIQVANAEKYGIDPRWVKPDGNIDWPPNNGFAGGVEIRELQSGQVFDRYGGRYVNGKFEDTGTFVAPTDVPFDQRALPNSALDSPKKTYEIVRPIPGVNAGQAAPWFGKPGGGIQYQLPFSIDYLLKNKFIKELN